jgi:putative ABC transport system permease protein
MKEFKTFFLLGSYLKIIARNFYRNRSYTILNLLGLSMGFAVFMFSCIYVYFESHFESFHQNAERIYRATYRFTPSDGYQSHWARVPFDYINELPNEIRGVKTLIRFQNHERKYVRVANEKFRPAHAYVTDKEVFQVFDFKLTQGDPSTALARPHSIVITRALAEKYFGGQDPMGKEIFVIGDLDRAETLHHITGVMEDLPPHTHLPVEMLISYKNAAERAGWAYTYIQLDQGSTISEVESQIPAFIRKYSPSEVEANSDAIIFQPLQSIHLQSSLAREIVPNGKVLYVRIVGFAGLFILAIAAINFMNLNSAMALGRAKEIGMRKVLGASRRQLIYYLLTESVIGNVTALMIGGGLAYAVFPYLQNFVAVEFLPNPWIFSLVMLAVAFTCGLASGVYPVILLASLKPLDVVRTTKVLSFAGKESAFSLKRIMVTLQFCVSIILLGSALIAYNQFKYISDKNLGMQREQIIAIPGVPDQVKAGFVAFKDRLMSQPGIAGVSACMEVPSREIRDAGPVLVEGINNDPTKAPMMDIQIIDHDFVSLLSIELLAGKNIQEISVNNAPPEFTAEFTIQNYLLNQQRSYLINETAMKRLGWKSPQEAIGQRISWSIGDMVLAPGPIAGIVRDFHQESLKNEVDPIVMVQEPIWLRTFLIKVETQNIQQSVAKIEAAWNDQFPFYPMEYYFLDDLYDNLYKGERVQLQLLFIFSGLAIVIAFIGLVGLIAYALKTRIKEIAVRKVLGASVGDLIRLISIEYFAVLLIGGAVAIPVSVYGVNEWLSGFAYRVDISPMSYVLALTVIIVLLLVTISLQTFRTSKINPAVTLRSE